jgi:hypothetical protein
MISTLRHLINSLPALNDDERLVEMSAIRHTFLQLVSRFGRRKGLLNRALAFCIRFTNPVLASISRLLGMRRARQLREHAVVPELCRRVEDKWL